METKPTVLATKAAGCGCGDGAVAIDLTEVADVRTVVREKYSAVAAGESCGCACCAGPDAGDGVLEQVGYTAEQIAAIPEGSNLGLGCGSPLAHATLAGGETVLDLGSGAGIDCFLAARAVGAQGHVIGVDMTPAMIEKARANASKYGYANVEFRLGEIEHLPLADNSVDLVISNCVINLSPDKAQVFREARRVLKPGGTLLVSDLVLERPLADAMRRSAELWAGCVAGASLERDYLEMTRAAGFSPVDVVEKRRYTVGAETLPEGSDEREAYDSVVSVKVRAIK